VEPLSVEAVRGWPRVERALVQILVVVAGTQARALRAEVGKGSVRTAVGHGLVDPKRRGKPYWKVHALWSKGNRVKIPGPERGCAYGNVNEPRDAGKGPRESYLFSLTARDRGIKKGEAKKRGNLFFLFLLLVQNRCVRMTLESVRPEIGLNGWESAPVPGASGALSPVLENPRERIISTPGRTHNRSRSPRWTASSW